MKVPVDTNNSWCTRNSPQGLEKRQEELEIRRIVSIQTTTLSKLDRILRLLITGEKLRSTQNPVENYQLKIA